MPTETTIPGVTAAASDTTSFARIPLALTGAGDRATGVACVQRITPKTSRVGTPYLDVDVGHAEGRTTLKVWSNELAAWALIPEGSAVALTLESKTGWRAGTFEWVLKDVVLLPENHPVRDDLLPQCPVPEVELTARWDALVSRLTPVGRTLLDVVLDHIGRDTYARTAAAERMHHAVVGGLRWHSIEVAEFALYLASAVPEYALRVDFDALIVGSLIHDVGKCLEISVDRGVGIRRAPTGWGRYHTTTGPEIVAVACALGAARLDAAGVTIIQIAHLKHVCESHHGDNREYGSPTPPRSIEAWFIHSADMASARARQLSDDMMGLIPNAEGWCMAMDGRRTPVFRPGTPDPTPRLAVDNSDLTTDAGPPPPRSDGRMLHLVVLRDASAIPTVTLSENA